MLYSLALHCSGRKGGSVTDIVSSPCPNPPTTHLTTCTTAHMHTTPNCAPRAPSWPALCTWCHRQHPPLPSPNLQPPAASCRAAAKAALDSDAVSASLRAVSAAAAHRLARGIWTSPVGRMWGYGDVGMLLTASAGWHVLRTALLSTASAAASRH